MHLDPDTIQGVACSEDFPSAEIAVIKESHGDEHSSAVRDCISVMLRQEETIYHCPDYLSSDWIAQQWSSSATSSAVHLVDECASLVSDLRLASESPEVSDSSSPSTEAKMKKSPSSTAVAAQFSGSRPVTPNLREHNSHLGPWRQQMCGWAFSTVDTFELDREIVAVAFHMLDRYLAKETLSFETITREDFQLFVMTALYIAVKMLEPTRKLSIESVIDMSRGFYSDLDILSTELDMLHSLKWYINPPTAVAFTSLFLEATSIKESPGFFSRCRRLSELAVQDTTLISCKASSVSVAAIRLCAERDCGYSKNVIVKFLADTKRLGVGLSDVTTVYHRLKALSSS